MIKRTFDLTMSFLLLLALLVPISLIAILVKVTSQGNVIHWSKRIGKNNQIFLMPKFRTMYTDTPQLATHLLQDRSRWITPLGRILRKASLDELPQLWSVFVGDMSLVGPRPALFNQEDLVEMRTNLGIERIAPGITGWAQVNGRDEISLERKVQLDHEYLIKQSLLLDLKIILMTLHNTTRQKDISH